MLISLCEIYNLIKIHLIKISYISAPLVNAIMNIELWMIGFIKYFFIND